MKNLWKDLAKQLEGKTSVVKTTRWFKYDRDYLCVNK
jgi:hypothetical protein